jgi:hypothetical protein
MNVVTMTMSVTAPKSPASSTPLASPIRAKLRHTSPRGIIPTPMTLFFPLNQNGAYTVSDEEPEVELVLDNGAGLFEQHRVSGGRNALEGRHFVHLRVQIVGRSLRSRGVKQGRS